MGDRGQTCGWLALSILSLSFLPGCAENRPANPLPIRIGLLADSQITSPDSTPDCLYRSKSLDKRIGCAIRPPALEHLGAEVKPVVQGQADFDVRQRRAEYEWNRAQTPPPVVVGRYDPRKHIASKIDTNVKVLKGIAVSPGAATGKARVITRTDDGQHVEPGEISSPRSPTLRGRPTSCRPPVWS